MIAAKVGYQEQNYFSYVFKKRFGYLTYKIQRSKIMFWNRRKHRLQNASIRSIIFMYFTITCSGSQRFYRSVPLWTAVRADVLCPSGGKSHSYQSVRPDHGLLPASGNETFRLPVFTAWSKNADLSDGSINGEITLLYDNNKDNVEKYRPVFPKEGELLESVPAARLKNNAQVADQDWFTAHLEKKQKIFIFFHASCTAYFLIQETASIVGWYLWQEQ